MKLLFAGLFLFSLLSSSAISFVELCHMDSPDHVQTSAELSPVLASSDSAQSQSGQDHNHCEVHCTHQAFSLSSGSFLIEQLFLEKNYPGYIFSFNQTYLEGPFRPPLV